MPMQQSQAWCATCQRMVLTQRAAPNHLIHALVTLFTCGAWAIVWAIVALNTPAWRCSACGTRPDPARLQA